MVWEVCVRCKSASACYVQEKYASYKRRGLCQRQTVSRASKPHNCPSPYSSGNMSIRCSESSRDSILRVLMAREPTNIVGHDGLRLDSFQNQLWRTLSLRRAHLIPEVASRADPVRLWWWFVALGHRILAPVCSIVFGLGNPVGRNSSIVFKFRGIVLGTFWIDSKSLLTVCLKYT